jgi:hypothetical protein
MTMTAPASSSPMHRPHSTWIEGLKAGVIGATGVVLWFIVVDAIGRRLLYTPRAMGEALAASIGIAAPGATMAIIGYTVFHYGVFVIVATILAAIVHRSLRDPSILAGTLLVFVAAEAAFIVFMTALDAARLFGRFGWVQLGLTNLIGAGLVGAYFWRTHPRLKETLDEGLGTIPERTGQRAIE